MAGNIEMIRGFYSEAFKHYDKDRSTPAIHIRFYPYVGINHTIRIRDGEVFVRIADICRDMPPAAQRGLAYVLVSKLYRRRAPAAARNAYAEYTKTREMRERATENKRERGRKVVTSHKGEVYDLDEIFDRLNLLYFQGSLKKPVLTWSARRTYRVLGHHDATHQTVVISRSLDSRDVPRYVVEYVLFHEMLHIHHPTVHHNGRRYNHTPAFRRDEQKFAFYQEAEDWIEKNVSRLKRSVKRETRRR